MVDESAISHVNFLRHVRTGGGIDVEIVVSQEEFTSLQIDLPVCGLTFPGLFSVGNSNPPK